MPLAINQLMSDIKFLNEEELIELNRFVVATIKHVRNEESRRMKRQLFIGTKVSFEDNDGNTVSGSVTKIMRKFARVQVGPLTWRVPLNSLTKEAAA